MPLLDEEDLMERDEDSRAIACGLDLLLLLLPELGMLVSALAPTPAAAMLGLTRGSEASPALGLSELLQLLPPLPAEESVPNGVQAP